MFKSHYMQLDASKYWVVQTSQFDRVAMNMKTTATGCVCVCPCVHVRMCALAYVCIVRVYCMLQWNPCIMDTLGPTKSVQIIKVSYFPGQFT